MTTIRPRFLSRRALLKLMSSTPVAVAASTTAAFEAYAQTSDPTQEQASQYALVASNQWAWFIAGVSSVSPEVRIAPDVVREASELSGPFLLRSLSHFDKDGNHAETGRCCVACGMTAARYAMKNATAPLITRDIFNMAWCDTKKCFEDATCRANNIDTGNSVPMKDVRCPNPPTLSARSLGCG